MGWPVLLTLDKWYIFRLSCECFSNLCTCASGHVLYGNQFVGHLLWIIWNWTKNLNQILNDWTFFLKENQKHSQRMQFWWWWLLCTFKHMKVIYLSHLNKNRTAEHPLWRKDIDHQSSIYSIKIDKTWYFLVPNFNH